MMRFSVCVFLWLWAAVPLSAQLDPVLLLMRDWTSTDGRTIRAEVLGFDGDSVQFRLEGGQRAPVPELRLSPHDRAELVRLRFREQCWIQAGEAANTNFYYSHLTPDDKSHSGIVALISVGPSRFLFEIKVHSQTVDLRTYDRIHLATAGGVEAVHSYRNAVSWGTAPEETTRVVIQVGPQDPAGIVPVLAAGLAEGGGLEFSASRDGAERVGLPLEAQERAALADLLSLFSRAQPLLVEGVIKNEPLDSQDFAKADPGVAPGPVPAPAGAGTSPEPPLELSPDEEAALARMSTGRGSGRFGAITWTGAGGAPRTVNGLGWMRDRVVVREGDGAPMLVPFSEIDATVREGLLQRRLSEFSGNRPPEDASGTLYYPKDWTEHRRKTRQGLVYGTEKDSGRPMLVIQGLSNRFQGGRITELAIRGDLGRGYITVPVGAAANQIERKDGTVWTYATVRVDHERAGELAKLAGGKALDLRISSGEDSSTFPLANGHLETSLEALRCYQWATLVP